MSNLPPIGIFATGAHHAAGTHLLPTLAQKAHSLQRFSDDFPTAVGRIDGALEDALNERAASDRHFRRLDRTAQLAIQTGEAALKQLQQDRLPNPLACIVASSRGPTLNWETQHALYMQQPEGRMSPFASPTTTPGHLASALQQQLGLTGPAFSLSMTCSSGLWALGNAMAWIRAGWVDAALAGGTEAAISGFTLAQMHSLKVLNHLPEHEPDAAFPSRPFAAGERNTMALGEGAALFVLAPSTNLNQTPQALIGGFGFGSEQIPNHAGITAHGGNLTTAMRMACGEHRPDVILTHAPGTHKGDAAELQAIRAVFGQAHPAVYSNKWCIGHTFGAAGAISVAQAVEMLAADRCPDMPYATDCARAVSGVKSVLVNAVGFGGWRPVC